MFARDIRAVFAVFSNWLSCGQFFNLPLTLFKTVADSIVIFSPLDVLTQEWHRRIVPVG